MLLRVPLGRYIVRVLLRVPLAHCMIRKRDLILRGSYCEKCRIVRVLLVIKEIFKWYANH